MVQSSDPNQPQAPTSPDGASTRPAEGDNALGFAAAANKEEKYNTRYLASNLQKERRTVQFIMLGVIGAMLLGAIVWFSIAPTDDAPTTPQAAVTAAEVPTVAPENAPK